jgi:general secretion pathway protein K
VPEENWTALADWIDKGEETRSGGAENAYYLGLNPPYRAADQPLTTLAELSLVKGFLPEYLAELRPFVTVYAARTLAGQSMVNLNTAPREVIAALDDSVDERLVETIDEQRRLQPFQDLADLNSRVPGGSALTQKLGSTVIDVKGTTFRIIAVARVKETARTVEAVVNVTSGAADILSWQEY